jgi:uncharacterized damage-inducible protein DinB
MNTNDVLKYGHQTVLQTIEGLPEAEWHTPGVCGVWSVKEIIAHLASFEHLLVDVLNSLLDESPTPTLDKFFEDHLQFNDTEVLKRRDKTVSEVWAEYEDTHAQTAALMNQIPPETRRQNGILSWYGAEYDLDDFIAYTFYGHKREHCAQIAVFRDQLTG